MLTHPQFDPVAVSLGPLKVHWYGLMYLLAFAVGYALALYRAKKSPNWNEEQVSDLVFYTTLGVILGGRMGYVLFYEFGRFIENPLWLFKVWEGGMSFHGGFLGVAIALIFFSKKYHKNFLTTTDFIIPCVPIGLMFGRIGNFINGELWGRPVIDQSYPLAMVFPQHDLTLRHPSQIYQALGEGLLLFTIIWWFSSKPRPRAAVSGLFLVGYGLFRSAAEFFREPDNNTFVFDWVTKGQLLSLPMILVGMALLLWAYKTQIYDK